MSTFITQEKLADDLLKKPGIFCVHKVTRSGCTMSLVKEGYLLGKKVVLFCPTIRIIQEVENKVSEITKPTPRITSILSNPELCRKLDPNLQMKFQFKPSCEKCEYEKTRECLVQMILNEDYDVYVLTYDKLKALQMSSSSEARELIRKLSNCHVFVFDEFSTAVFASIPALTIKEIDKERNLITLRQNLKRSLEDLGKFNNTTRDLFWTLVDQFLDQFENVEKGTTVSNVWLATCSEDDVRRLFNDVWRLLTEMTKKGVDTVLLQEVALVVFSKEIVVLYENSTIKVTPKLEDALGYLRKFCEDLRDDKTVLLVDSYQPTLSFDKVFAENVQHVLWGGDGDPSQTNRKQLLICDRCHWGASDFLKGKYYQERVKFFLKRLVSSFCAENILIVTTNTDMAKIIATWGLSKKVKITWFRSDLMRGVHVENRRIMVTVGGSYLPKNTYVAESQSFNFEYIVTEAEKMTDEEKTLRISRLLRLDDTRSEFINAIGRAKDPSGKEPSVVFTLAMTSVDVNAMLSQPEQFRVSRPNVVQPFAKGGLIRDGIVIAEMWLVKAPGYIPKDYLDDLPLLARIVRAVRHKIEVRASEIVPRQTGLVIKKAEQYKALLKYYNVEVKEKRGGTSFITRYATLDHFNDKNQQKDS